MLDILAKKLEEEALKAQRAAILENSIKMIDDLLSFMRSKNIPMDEEQIVVKLTEEAEKHADIMAAEIFRFKNIIHMAVADAMPSKDISIEA